MLLLPQLLVCVGVVIPIQLEMKHGTHRKELLKANMLFLGFILPNLIFMKISFVMKPSLKQSWNPHMAEILEFLILLNPGVSDQWLLL